jgi:predicted nucleic acid-binding protein
MKVADTTLLIDHARGEEAAETVLESHAEETLVAPAVAFQELAVGEVAARDRSRQQVLADLGPFNVRAYTAEHAYEAAAIESTLRLEDEYRPALADDIQIGGVARLLGVPVLTRNIEDFELFDGVRSEVY